MDILPSDLGEERTVALMEYRAATAHLQLSGYSKATRAAFQPAHPAVRPIMRAATEKPAGFWTRFWTKGTNLSPDAARHAVRNMSGTVAGLAGGFGFGSVVLLIPSLAILAGHDPIPGLVLAASGAGMAALGVGLPRYLLNQYATKPLTLGEIEMLTEVTDDPTEKAFLSVVAAALRQPDFPNTRTADDLREALRTLGEAIDKLPRVSAPRLSVSSLQDAAQKAYGEADAETDPIIAASLRRRADAQAKTAQAAQKTELLVRRANALRGEIDAQIQALNVGLSGFDGGFATNAQNQDAAQNAAAHLNQLAQSVQGVAREAGSLWDARDEVAAWTGPHVQTVHPALPTRPPAPPDAEVIVLGRTNP